jgi:hypothetical protein
LQSLFTAHPEVCIDGTPYQRFIRERSRIQQMSQRRQRTRNRQIIVDGTGSFRNNKFVAIVQKRAMPGWLRRRSVTTAAIRNAREE